MRAAIFAFSMILICFVNAAPTFGAVSGVQADLAWPAGRGDWELVVVRVTGTDDGESVGVRDARGGMRVWRGAEMGEGEEARVLVPVPVVAAADVGDAWPLEITVRSVTGETTREVVQVKRTGGDRAPLRLAGTEGMEGFGALRNGAVGYFRMSEEDILSGPLMVFLGCDAVALSDRVAGRLSADRIAGLLGAGVQLVSLRDPAKMTGVLGRMKWDAVSPGVWMTHETDLPRGRVIEPGMERVPALSESVLPGRGTIVATLLVPVGGLVVVTLAFGLFRRRGLVLAAFALGMAGVTAGTIWYLYANALPDEKAVSWQISQPGEGTAVSVTERFASTSALFGEKARVIADQDQLLFPVNVSLLDYLRMRGAELYLDVLSEDGLRRESRLEMPLRAREMLCYGVRTSALIPAAVDTARGVWIEGGYITPTAVETPDASGGSPMLLTRWAAEHAEIKDSLLAWYEMGRFQANHRYFLFDGEPVKLADFGETVPVTPPP
jgi:hypothetical protein